MSKDYFDFKKFRVWHHASAMKVGTDAVVLGCLVPTTSISNTILDIGTGTGIIALMLAQRNPEASITAIEIDIAAAQQANYNFEQSIFASQLKCVPISVQNFALTANQKFDLIVSNPPFFEKHANAAIADNARSLARQDVALSFHDLAHSVSILLQNQGCFWLILPVQEAQVFALAAASFSLNLSQQINIIPRQGKASNRVVQCYQMGHNKLLTTKLILKNEAGLPSQEYIDLSRDFYLRIDL
jgi:tRNA1Val (adenine37-N6)-methyltransferase